MGIFCLSSQIHIHVCDMLPYRHGAPVGKGVPVMMERGESSFTEVTGLQTCTCWCNLTRHIPNYKIKVQPGDKKRSQWLQLLMWGEREVCKLFKKGFVKDKYELRSVTHLQFYSHQ